MTEIKKPTLDQWFLAKQLKKVNQGLHLPFFLEADITALVQTYQKREQRVPYTALLIKACSQLIFEMPEVNGAIFHTFYGNRIVSPQKNLVNLPISLELDGKFVLSAVTIEDAYQKPLKKIKQEIQEKKPRSLADLTVNSLLHKKHFHFWQKCKLTLIHALYSNFPSFYLNKGGGGISVSSLMNLSRESSSVHMNAFGPTILTISSCSVKEKGDKKIFFVGVGFNHILTHGAVGTAAALRLCEILQEITVDEAF